MMETILVYGLIFCSTTTHALDPEVPVGMSTSDKNWEQREPTAKKINKGDWEVEGRIGLGYSTYFGPNTDIGGKIRYFLWDRVSVGLLFDHATAGWRYTTEFGLSGRAYLFESKNWSLSLNQQFTLMNTQYLTSFSRLQGQTGLGLHYYLTPSFALGLHLDTGYAFGKDGPAVSISNPLKTSFGLTWGF